MRKGKITRPPGAKEPIIRLVGNAEALLIHDEEQVSIPNTRKDWDEILYSMFHECEDTPLRIAGGVLIGEETQEK